MYFPNVKHCIYWKFTSLENCLASFFFFSHFLVGLFVVLLFNVLILISLYILNLCLLPN